METQTPSSSPSPLKKAKLSFNAEEYREIYIPSIEAQYSSLKKKIGGNLVLLAVFFVFTMSEIGHILNGRELYETPWILLIILLGSFVYTLVVLIKDYGALKMMNVEEKMTEIEAWIEKSAQYESTHIEYNEEFLIIYLDNSIFHHAWAELIEKTIREDYLFFKWKGHSNYLLAKGSLPSEDYSRLMQIALDIPLAI
ncbi:MAG: hypothetical protein AAFY71_03825 [Bacteroidota bacterium]